MANVTLDDFVRMGGYNRPYFESRPGEMQRYLIEETYNAASYLNGAMSAEEYLRRKGVHDDYLKGLSAEEIKASADEEASKWLEVLEENAMESEGQWETSTTPRSEGEIKRAEVEEAVEPTDENIDKLLDAMGVEGKERELFRSAYETNPESFKKDYAEFVGGEKPQPAAPQKQVVVPTTESAAENEIVSDNDKPFPTKEVKGKKVPDFKGATPERTRHFLYEEMGYDKETADGVVKNGISATKDALKKHEAKKPKAPAPEEVFDHADRQKAWEEKKKELEAEQKYWEDVAKAQESYDLLEQVRAAKSPKDINALVNKLRVRFGGKERDGEIYGALTYFTPGNLYDACMAFLSSGVRFVWDATGAKRGLRQQTGWGEGERKKLLSMLAGEDKGGITPEAAVHRIVDLYGGDLGLDLSQSSEIFETLLEALQSIATKGDAYAYINKQKLAKVEDILLKRLDGRGESRYDEEADRRADEEFEAFKEEYQDELPENPTEDDVFALMDKKRQEREEPASTRASRR